MPKLDTFKALRFYPMALFMLISWFLTALVLPTDLSYPVATRWLAHPSSALTMIAVIAITTGAAAFGIWSAASIALTPA